jgi:hypothetical protein
MVLVSHSVPRRLAAAAVVIGDQTDHVIAGRTSTVTLRHGIPVLLADTAVEFAVGRRSVAVVAVRGVLAVEHEVANAAVRMRCQLPAVARGVWAVRRAENWDSPHQRIDATRLTRTRLGVGGDDVVPLDCRIVRREALRTKVVCPRVDPALSRVGIVREQLPGGMALGRRDPARAAVAAVLLSGRIPVLVALAAVRPRRRVVGLARAAVHVAVRYRRTATNLAGARRAVRVGVGRVVHAAAAAVLVAVGWPNAGKALLVAPVAVAIRARSLWSDGTKLVGVLMHNVRHRGRPTVRHGVIPIHVDVQGPGDSG